MNWNTSILLHKHSSYLRLHHVLINVQHEHMGGDIHLSQEGFGMTSGPRQESSSSSGSYSQHCWVLHCSKFFSRMEGYSSLCSFYSSLCSQLQGTSRKCSVLTRSINRPIFYHVERHWPVQLPALFSVGTTRSTSLWATWNFALVCLRNRLCDFT